MPISEQVLRDLRDILRKTQDGLADCSDSEHLVFRVLPSLLDEVESLRDSTLQKDFIALYQSARLLTSADLPASPPGAGVSELRSLIEGLGLHVVRLAPLYDDVRMQLSLRSQAARDAYRQALGGPMPFVLQGAVPARPGQRLRSEVDPSLLDLRPGPITRASDPAHSVRVLQSDGTGRVECNHTFKGTTRCVHCGKAFAELRAEALAALSELTHLTQQLPDGVLHATPEQLADIVQQQLDEHEGRGIMPALHGLSELDAALEPDDELSVPITLGPSLRPRVEALVATGRLGDDIERVVQTLFVLGMLDAEGQDPQAHIGEPQSHVSAEALFVRFGLPHEGDAAVTRQRSSILRQLLLDLSEWCDPGDPLRPAFAAAIEALPR